MLIPFGVLSAAGAGGPVFPSGITGLVARYDATNAGSISLSGSEVTQWNDLSGNGHHATQGTSINRPKSGTVTINGKNAIDFDGTNDYLFNNGVASSFSGNDKPFTIFWVQDKDVANSTPWMFGFDPAGVAYIWSYGDSMLFRDDAVTTTSISGTGSSSLSPVFMTFRSSGLSFTAWSNKTQTVSATAYDRGNITVNISTIGAYRQGTLPELYLDGSIGELIYYNRELTTGEVAQVQDYLSAKWGI